MRQLQCLQHQHLFSLSNLASRQNTTTIGGVLFSPFPRLVLPRHSAHRFDRCAVFQAAPRSFAAAVFDPLKRRDIQEFIDRAYGLREHAGCHHALCIRAGAFALRCRMPSATPGQPAVRHPVAVYSLHNCRRSCAARRRSAQEYVAPAPVAHDREANPQQRRPDNGATGRKTTPGLVDPDGCVHPATGNPPPAVNAAQQGADQTRHR